MADEQPSWLDGDDGKGSAPVADLPPPIPTPEPAAPSPLVAEPTTTATTNKTDNVAGSILSSMNKDVNTTQSKIAAVAAVEDEKDLPKLILFMRVLNMAAAVLLITCSVRFIVCIIYIGILVHPPTHEPAPNLSIVFYITTDNSTNNHTTNFSLGNINLCNLRRSLNMLPRNPIKIHPYNHCPKLWFPLPFHLSTIILPTNGICHMELP